MPPALTSTHIFGVCWCLNFSPPGKDLPAECQWFICTSFSRQALESSISILEGSFPIYWTPSLLAVLLWSAPFGYCSCCMMMALGLAAKPYQLEVRISYSSLSKTSTSEMSLMNFLDLTCIRWVDVYGFSHCCMLCTHKDLSCCSCFVKKDLLISPTVWTQNFVWWWKLYMFNVILNILLSYQYDSVLPKPDWANQVGPFEKVHCRCCRHCRGY